MNDTHRDTVDCLLSELKDAYAEMMSLEESKRLRYCSGAETDELAQVRLALASIERAYQLVSDLKAAQS